MATKMPPSPPAQPAGQPLGPLPDPPSPIGNAAAGDAKAAEPPGGNGIESDMLALSPPRPAPEGEAFDHWLRLELSRLFDGVLAEPVPDSLLRVLRDDGMAVVKKTPQG